MSDANADVAAALLVPSAPATAAAEANDEIGAHSAPARNPDSLSTFTTTPMRAACEIGLPLSKGRPSVVRPMGMIGLCKRLSSDRGSNTLGSVQLAGAGVRAGCGECRVWSASGPWSAAGPGR